MKSPAEYLELARTDYPAEGEVFVIPVADAERAVALALADAERNKRLLMSAVLKVLAGQRPDTFIS